MIAGVKNKKSIHSAQIIKLLKIFQFIERSMLCLPPTRLCATLKTVVWSIIVKIFETETHVC